MAVPKDHAKNLQTLSLFIAMDVGNAMMASYVTRVADRWFYQYPEKDQAKAFRTHPANTLTSTALGALFARSVVHMSEVLRDEHGAHPVTCTIRRKAELFDHRDALSHAVTVKWRRKAMQEFADADRAVYEHLPALVWDANRSINEELQRLNLPLRNERIEATGEMAAMLRIILELSMQVEPPSRDDLFTYLQKNAATYQAQLEKHPDGGRDLAKEKQRTTTKRAKWEALRKKWAAAAKA